MGLNAAPAPSRAELIDRLLGLMPRVRRQFQARMPADVGDELAGITPHQFEALHMLHHVRDEGAAAGGATMNELARHQQCALSTATALVDRLIRQGLAERSSDPDDRRVVRIALTTRGERLLSRFTDAKHAFMVEALAPLSDAELAALLRLFAKVAAVVPPMTPIVHAMEVGLD